MALILWSVMLWDLSMKLARLVVNVFSSLYLFLLFAALMPSSTLDLLLWNCSTLCLVLLLLSFNDSMYLSYSSSIFSLFYFTFWTKFRFSLFFTPTLSLPIF